VRGTLKTLLYRIAFHALTPKLLRPNSCTLILPNRKPLIIAVCKVDSKGKILKIRDRYAGFGAGFNWKMHETPPEGLLPVPGILGC
jgi:hypothetical protein